VLRTGPSVVLTTSVFASPRSPDEDSEIIRYGLTQPLRAALPHSWSVVAP
jgi:hypothetical protein